MVVSPKTARKMQNDKKRKSRVKPKRHINKPTPTAPPEVVSISWSVKDISCLRPDWSQAKCAKVFDELGDDIMDVCESAGVSAGNMFIEDNISDYDEEDDDDENDD
jgi:hypothetical protein